VSGEVVFYSEDLPLSMLRKAREKAIQEMIKEAKDLGANAVIGVTISMYVLEEGGHDYRIQIATGTAVRL
jgi:uncharacterized protein YbjQ (UPF0145 family)